MKTKTRKLIAAVAATALLGTAVGVGVYALNNSTENDFGFKGTYSLNALADNAAASTVTVAGKSIDTTTTLTLKSSDAEQAYTLFVTIVDTDDMTELADINVGYTVGGNTYNAQASGLSNVVYSSLTVNTGNEEEPTATVTAAELATSFTSTITSPKLVIAEVEGDLSASTSELTITAALSASNVNVKVTGQCDATAGTDTIKDAFGQELTIASSNATLGADPFYVNTAKTVYFEGEGKTFRIPASGYLQTTGAEAPLYVDLTDYEEGVDMLLTINASSTGSSNVGHLNRYLIIKGNGQDLESQSLNVSGSGIDCKFIVKSGYKYQIDNSNGLRIYSISYATATETDAADVLTQVTVTVKDKLGNTIATITEDSTLTRPTLYVGSALTSAGATATITAALPENATWDKNIYTDEACTKPYSEMTRLTGDITLYVDVAYPTDVVVNYGGGAKTITKTIGSELTLDEIVAALAITVADNQKLVCKVESAEVTLPITVVAGLTIDAELVTATTITITYTDADEVVTNVGEVKITAQTDMTYAELAACVTTIPSGMELSAITVDGKKYESGYAELITIDAECIITATFVAASAKTDTIDISTLESSYAADSTVYDGTLFTMSTKIKLTKKSDYIVTNSGKTDSSSTPIVFTAKQNITLSLKANVGNSGLTGSFTDTNNVIYQVYNSDGTASGDAVSTVTTKTSTFIDLNITLEAGQYVNLYFTTSSSSTRYLGFSSISATT
ncbi:MAG: hypothetical protein ACI4MN_00075 [Candidatus Coproplasma sp.]